MATKRSWMMALAVAAAATGMTAVGCGNGDDTTTTPAATDGGSADGSKGDAGDAGVADAGDAGDGATQSLYDKLGQHAGIRAAVDAVVAAELKDSDEVTYFFFQGGAPGNGHPTAGQVEECFTFLLSNAAGGPEQYPPDGGVQDDSGAGDAGVWQCRADMAAIHAPLLISGGTFDKFLMIAGATLGAPPFSLDAPTITIIATALGNFKPAIVTQSLADAGPQTFPGDSGAAPTDSGAPADAGDAGGDQ